MRILVTRCLQVAVGLGVIAALLPAASAIPIGPGEIGSGLPPYVVSPAQQEVGRVAAAVESSPASPGNTVPQPVPPGAGELAPPGWLDLSPLAWGLAGAGALAILAGTRFMRREDVLESDVRSRLYGYLLQNVGANLKQLTEDLKLSTTNAVWHLRKLESTGLVHSRKFNGYKVYYLAEGGVEAREVTLSAAALANGNARSIFEYVAENPGSHQREIARTLGVNHGTVRWHLKKLCATGLLREMRRGRISVYEAIPRTAPARAVMKPREVEAPSAA